MKEGMSEAAGREGAREGGEVGEGGKGSDADFKTIFMNVFFLVRVSNKEDRRKTNTP